MRARVGVRVRVRVMVEGLGPFLHREYAVAIGVEVAHQGVHLVSVAVVSSGTVNIAIAQSKARACASVYKV